MRTWHQRRGSTTSRWRYVWRTSHLLASLLLCIAAVSKVVDPWPMVGALMDAIEVHQGTAEVLVGVAIGVDLLPPTTWLLTGRSLLSGSVHIIVGLAFLAAAWFYRGTSCGCFGGIEFLNAPWSRAAAGGLIAVVGTTFVFSSLGGHNAQ